MVKVGVWDLNDSSSPAAQVANDVPLALNQGLHLWSDVCRVPVQAYDPTIFIFVRVGKYPVQVLADLRGAVGAALAPLNQHALGTWQEMSYAKALEEHSEAWCPWAS